MVIEQQVVLQETQDTLGPCLKLWRSQQQVMPLKVFPTDQPNDPGSEAISDMGGNVVKYEWCSP